MTPTIQTTEKTKSTYKKGHEKENGQRSPAMIKTKSDLNTRNQDTKITGADADSAEHPTGPDNIYAHLDR